MALGWWLMQDLIACGWFRGFILFGLRCVGFSCLGFDFWVLCVVTCVSFAWSEGLLG